MNQQTPETTHQDQPQQPAPAPSIVRRGVVIKLKQICGPNFIEAVQKLATVQFPNYKDSYALSRTLRQLQNEFETYESARQAAIKKYGREHYIVAPDKKAAFDAEVSALPVMEKAAREAAVYDISKRHGTVSPNHVVFVGDDRKKFEDEVTAIGETDVELFLDHKLLFAGQVKGAERLTAADFDSLADLLEVK